MSVHRFSIGKQFRWCGVLHEVKRLLPDGEVNIEDVATGAVRVVTLAELVAALFDEALFFVVRGHSTAKTDNNDEAKATGVESRDLSDYPDHVVAIARRRLEIIQPLLDLGTSLTDAAVQSRVAEVKAQQEAEAAERALMTAVSVRTVYRWIRDYRRSGGDIRVLIPATQRRGGGGKSRLEPEVEAMVQAIIREQYYRREKVTIRDLHYLIAAEVDDENKLRPKGEWLQCPCESTVASRVDALDMYDRFATRHGKRAARRAFSQYGQMDYPTRPLERVEIDATPVDLIVVDEHDFLPLGRPNLTKALDTATRYPLGWYLGFEPPSYYSAMECLYHAIRPKPDTKELYDTEHQLAAYGIPYLLMVDNGKEFIGVDIEDACLSLGIILQYSPVKTPWFKAAIERHLRTCTGLFHTLPGTSFSDIFQRGDYDSAGQACMTLGDLDQTLHLFLVDIYAERLHKGLGGVPARRWEAAMAEGFSPRLPESAGELRVLLGRVAHRTVQHYGIDFLNLRYNCPSLAPLRHRLNGDQTKIKYHPGDLGTIYVHDPFNGVYIEAPCLQDEYAAGLSLWKHRVICTFVRRHQDKVDLPALGRAKRKIQEVVDAAMSRKRRRSGKALARWNSGGQPAGGGSVVPKSAASPQGQHRPIEAPPAVRPALPDDDDDTLLYLEPHEEAGWGISYDKHEDVERVPAARPAGDSSSHTEALDQEGEQPDDGSE